MNKFSIVFLFQFIFLSISCVNTVEIPQVYYSVSGETQGTTYHIKYKANKGLELNNQIDSILHVFDLSLSTYDSTSIISRVNQGDKDVVPDNLFTNVFNTSKEINKKTDGYFDITVAPIVNAWGFGYTNEKNKTVSKEYIDSLLEFTGMENISIKEKKIIKKDPRITLDVNAIAQGYSVDYVVNYFESLGLTDYLVEIGGELRTKGLNSKGVKWRIGVDKPIEGNNLPGRNMQVILKISGISLATSGNYRKFFEENGVKYAHSIDPKTGYPAQQNLLSATILSKSCMIADAYATACMVMGFEKAKKLIESTPEIEGYLIYNDDKGKYQIYYTEALSNLIAPPFQENK